MNRQDKIYEAAVAVKEGRKKSKVALPFWFIRDSSACFLALVIFSYQFGPGQAFVLMLFTLLAGMTIFAVALVFVAGYRVLRSLM